MTRTLAVVGGDTVGEPDAQAAQRFLGHDVGVGDDEHEVAASAAGGRGQPMGQLLADDLDDRSADAALAIQRQPGEALGAGPPGLLGELVDLLAAEVGETGRRQADDAPARGEHGLEDAESRALRQIGEVVELHAVANVGLVRSEAVDGLAVREAREGVGEDGSLGNDGARDGEGHALHPGHDVVLAHEAHLQVELGELGLAVAAQVLVAQAARDLEVAVEAADHEQLLELLGALGQRVDVARLEPRRAR